MILRDHRGCDGTITRIQDHTVEVFTLSPICPVLVLDPDITQLGEAAAGAVDGFASDAEQVSNRLLFGEAFLIFRCE